MGMSFVVFDIVVVEI